MRPRCLLIWVGVKAKILFLLLSLPLPLPLPLSGWGGRAYANDLFAYAHPTREKPFCLCQAGGEGLRKTNAHAGSRTRVTSMGGFYDAATLHAL